MDRTKKKGDEGTPGERGDVERHDLTIHDVAWEMVISPPATRKLIYSGHLVAYYINGKWRITRESVEKFKREHSNETLLRKPEHDLERDVALAAKYPIGLDPLGPDVLTIPLSHRIHKKARPLWLKGILWGYAPDPKLSRLRFPVSGVLYAIDRGILVPGDRRPPAAGTRRRRRSSLLAPGQAKSRPRSGRPAKTS